MRRKPAAAFERTHFFVTFLLRNKKVKKKFKETCFFGLFLAARQEMNRKKFSIKISFKKKL